jgi:hypothetical protein
MPSAPTSSATLTFILHHVSLAFAFHNVHNIAPNIANRIQFHIRSASTGNPPVHCVHDSSASAIALKDHLPAILHWVIRKKKLASLVQERHMVVGSLSISFESWPSKTHTCLVSKWHFHAHWEAPKTHEIE